MQMKTLSNEFINEIMLLTEYEPICHMKFFRHSMVTNWCTMTARAQMEQVRLQELSLKNMKSMDD